MKLGTGTLAAVCLFALLAVTGCGGTQPVPAATFSGGSTAAATRTTDSMHPELGPANPVVGQIYAYDLYAHCSGEYAVFGGAWWHTATPPGNPVPSQRADGTTVYDGYLAGWMTLISKDTAVFAVAGSTATFVYERSSPGHLCD